MTLGMKLRNHSQSRNPATPGRTLVRERCFVGEGKFDSAKREGKCVSMRQTLVPVTEAQGCMRTWCAREDLNLQSFRNQILSLARLPFRHARVVPEHACSGGKIQADWRTEHKTL